MLCVGYVGFEAFDVILYIGRTLTKLNYRVLIIDLSDTRAFLNAIKHGMGLDSSKDIVNYRSINYIRRLPSKEELMEFNDGVIFMNYGAHYSNCSELKCNLLNVVVNTFPNTVEHINTLFSETEIDTTYDLLIRDVLTRDDVERIVNEMELHIPLSNVSYLYLDPTDYESAVNCQIAQIVQFTRVSSHMKKYIEQRIHRMLPMLTIGKIRKAIKAARKGA